MKNNSAPSPLSYIDSLRGIAIILVFLVHSGAFLSHINVQLPLFETFGFGQYGVQLFFLVSAYTLFRSLDLRSSHQNYILEAKKFFIRRFFRIAPLYYLMILFSFFILGNGNVSSFLLDIFFVNGFDPYHESIVTGEWSIFTEMMFYLALPFIFKYAYTSYFKLLSLLLISIFSSLWITFNAEIQLLHFHPFKWFYVFILGGFLYKLQSDFKLDKFTSQYWWMITSIIVGLLVFDYYFLRFSGTEFYFFGIKLVFIPKSVEHFLVIIMFFLFFVLLQHEGKITFLFNNFVTQYIGKISFSIFLTHMFIIKLASGYSVPEMFQDHKYFALILYMLVTFLITTFISHFLYNFVEKRGIQMGKFIITNHLQNSYSNIIGNIPFRSIRWPALVIFSTLLSLHIYQIAQWEKYSHLFNQSALLHNYALSHFQKGDFKNAEYFYHQALQDEFKIQQWYKNGYISNINQTQSMFIENIRGTYQNLSITYREMREHELGKKLFFIGNNLIFDNKPQQYGYVMANLHEEVGDLYVKRNKLFEAETFYTYSLYFDSSKSRKVSLAQKYLVLGNLFYMNGISENKKQYFEAAERNYLQSLEFYHLLENQEKIAELYGNLGNVYHRLGHLKQAREMYLNSLQLFKLLGSPKAQKVQTMLQNVEETKVSK